VPRRAARASSAPVSSVAARYHPFASPPPPAAMAAQACACCYAPFSRKRDGHAAAEWWKLPNETSAVPEDLRGIFWLDGNWDSSLLQFSTSQYDSKRRRIYFQMYAVDGWASTQTLDASAVSALRLGRPTLHVCKHASPPHHASRSLSASARRTRFTSTRLFAWVRSTFPSIGAATSSSATPATSPSRAPASST